MPSSPLPQRDARERWRAPEALYVPATVALELAGAAGRTRLWLALVRTPTRAEASVTAVPSDARARLYPGERARLDAMAGVRAHDFAAGRLAAHAALGGAGAAEPIEVTSDAHGRPVAPEGLSLSVSHAPGLAAAAVLGGERSRVGVDVERIDRPRGSIARRVLGADELAAWQASPSPELCLARAFAVKEAIYKAVHPYVERYVRFHEVELDPSLAPTPRGDELARVPLVPRFEPALIDRSSGAPVALEAHVTLVDDGWVLALAVARAARA